jgi:hypothetical protein
MRHRASFLSVAIIVLAALMSISLLSSVTAQDATPEQMIGAEGVSFVPLAFAAVETLPPAPAGVVLSRYQIEPGAAQRSDAADPSLALVYQESGTGTIRLEAPVVVTRGDSGAQEEISANTDFTLEPGDSFLWPPHVAGEARNDGDEPVIALVVVVLPDESATPVP